MQIAVSSPLVVVALLVLLVFFLAPNRYLNCGHWGGALLLMAFIMAMESKGHDLGPEFAAALVGGAGLLGYWIVHDRPSKQQEREDAAVPAQDPSREREP